MAAMVRSMQHTAAQQGAAETEAQPGHAVGLHAGLQQLQQLARSAAIAADLAALSRQQGAAAAAAAADSSKPPAPSSAVPSQTAKAYADYIRRLARDVSSSSSSAGPCSASCKLLAHVYALYITHLTTGSRVGAAAAEKLHLVPAGALAMYQSFPAAAGDPLQCFVAGMNSVGQGLTAEQNGQVVPELPRAFTKTSLLLDVLARID